VQFVDARRVKFDTIREAKALFVGLDGIYPKMKFLTI
jgi:hypothetical protein